MDFTIRPIEIDDAKDINELRCMPGVFENILGTPAERVTVSESYIASMDGNSHQFVAVSKDNDGNERVIGTAGLSVSDNVRRRHSGAIGI
ncbi:MAG: GNAT family N-acetyltransferase, partial [Angelakisella sp.]